MWWITVGLNILYKTLFVGLLRCAPFVTQAFDGFPFDFHSVEAWETALLRTLWSSKAPSLRSPSVGLFGVPLAFLLRIDSLWLRRSSLRQTCILVGLELTSRLPSATDEGGTTNSSPSGQRPLLGADTASTHARAKRRARSAILRTVARDRP